MPAPPTLGLSSLFNIPLTTFKRTFTVAIKESKLKQSEYYNKNNPYKPAIQATQEDVFMTSGYICKHKLKRGNGVFVCGGGADEIAEWVKVLVAKADTLNWIPGTHKLEGEK